MPRRADAGEDSETGRPRYLSLQVLDAYFEVEADFSHTRVESRSGQALRRQRSQRNRDLVLEERVGLRFGGDFLDPRLVTFSGDLSFAVTQNRFKERIDSFENTDRDSGYLLQYDLRLNFLQGSKFSGSVYGLRNDDQISRRFQPTLNQRRSGFGTSWVFADDKLPMELSYDYLETDRTGNIRASDDEHFTESTLHYGLVWNISSQQRLRFSYEHTNSKQEYQGSQRAFETVRDLFIIEHDLDFGEQSRNNLHTLIHWQEESGDFARDFFEIGPQLTLHHSDNLQTIYKYQYNRERYEGLDIDTHRADFQLIHQIYSNLTTTVDVFGLYEGVQNDIRTTQYGASIDWQYNRKNRYGHLYANLALAYDTEEVDGGNGPRLVLNESHSFRDPLPIILRNRNVIPISVVVTDAANRRVFRLGIDYLMAVFGNVTQLVRVRNGQIADRGTVLIDYQYQTPADGKLDTIRVDISLEQRFSNGWTPYYRLSYRNQEDDASTGFFRRADRTDHHRLGVNFETEQYSFGAEYEVFDDTIDPYDAYHVRGVLHLIRKADRTMDASARFSQLFFDGGIDDRDVILLDLELDHRRQLSETVSTVQRIAYRLENDSTDGVTQAWDLKAGLAYVVGDLSAELTLEYDRLDLPRSEEDDFGLYLRVRREFPNVLGLR